MQPSRFGRSVCLHCAFRLRLRLLQQRRYSSSVQLADLPNDRASDRYTHAPSYQRSPRVSPSLYTKAGAPLVRRTWRLSEPISANAQRHKDSRDGFRSTVERRLKAVREELEASQCIQQFVEEAGEAGGREPSFANQWKSFTRAIRAVSSPGQEGETSITFNAELELANRRAVWRELQETLRSRGIYGLDDRIKYFFYGHVISSKFTDRQLETQKLVADLRYPTEWFPKTRLQQRHVHLHVGPTNSGKTYQALKKLEAAERGVYAGPLRLLAHEVFTRLNSLGVPCSLITGEEQRLPPGDETRSRVAACTVEMVPLIHPLDVAVVDEIQMIGNRERGWAWTQAFLGLRAKELHLCGEARIVPLIEELCASTGDKLTVHRYERLSPLAMAPRSLGGDLKQLRKGDCIVSFSVMGIHALRKEIEVSTGRKVAIVYGSLPPETRAQQARLFNDPDNDYDFLVASDAIGMGLNLAIKRTIFETSSKWDGTRRMRLPVAEIKQIGGRAGRFKTALQPSQTSRPQQSVLAGTENIGNPIKTDEAEDTKSVAAPGKEGESVGLVTTLEKVDYPIVCAAMDREPEPIRTAGLLASESILERFATYFPPRTPFSYVLTRLHEVSQIHQRFHLCDLRDQIMIADLIEPVEGLTISERNVFCSCPASSTEKEMWRKLLPALARAVATQSAGDLMDIEQIPFDVLETEPSTSREYLRELERLHRSLVVYLWLSYRFAGVFRSRPLARHVKEIVEEKIEFVLGQFSFTDEHRKKIAQMREKQITQELMSQKAGQEAAVQGSVQTLHEESGTIHGYEEAVGGHDAPDAIRELPLEEPELNHIRT